ncbi:MAG: ATP-dependent DNA ligase [Candidatus Micrarchaeales archaeon]|nr:ATP-dependent DNA ligase [Candidatus Micrarchaeales archaeon]
MLFKELASYYEKLEAVSSRLTMIDIMSELLKKAKPDEIRNVVYITQGILAPPSEGVEFGMAEKMVEESIAISTGFTKEEVEKEYKKTGDMGIAAQNIKVKSRLKRISSKEFTVNEVYDTMRKIAATSGSGSKDIKVKLLASLITASTPLETKYIVKYPLDELRLGVGDATVIEALSIVATGDRKLKAALEHAYNLNTDLGAIAEAAAKGGEKVVSSGFGLTLFKPVRPELAERLPTAEEILEKMGGKAAVDQKYDGFRVQVHKKGDKVKLFSRRLEDTTSMYPDLVEAVQKEIHADSAILDGEALAYNEATNEFLPFQATIQRKRKHGLEKKIEEMPLKLFAFDLMYLDGKDMMNEPYHKRREELEKLLKNGKTIVTAGSIIAKTPKELEDYFQSSIEAGLEGIIAKDLNSTYVAGARKFSWIKLKRSYRGELSDTLDLVIVGFYLGRGMRREFGFGGLLCATYNEKRDMFETVSRIGSGFTEKQMVELESVLGKIKSKSKPARVDALVEPDFWVTPRYVVTIRADEITKSPMHTCGREGDVGYALRFPRLVGENGAIRKDKSVEEATTTKEVIEMYRQQKRVSLGNAAEK